MSNRSSKWVGVFAGFSMFLSVSPVSAFEGDLDSELAHIVLPTAVSGKAIGPRPVLVTIDSTVIRVEGMQADRIDMLRKDGYWAAPLLNAALAQLAADRKEVPEAALESSLIAINATRAREKRPPLPLKQGAVLLAAEPATPYRVIKKVLYAAGKSGFTEMYLAVRRPGKATVVALRLPQGPSEPPAAAAGIFAGATRVVRPVIAEATVGEGLIPELVDAVAKRNLQQIQYCFERQLPNNPDLHGKLVVGFTIGADGLTTNSGIRSSTVGSDEVANCVAARFRKMRFPAPKNGREVQVELPMYFRAR